MKPYSHFLTPSGKAAIAQAPPYHYGADYLPMYFRSNPQKLQQFLPDQLRVTDGSAVAYVSDFVCTASEEDLGAPYSDPAQSSYREAAIGIRCSYRGTPGIYYPFMWVDRDWSLIRGWSLGYAKKVADDIRMTRLHKLTPHVPYFGPGVKLSGYCTRHGDRLLSISMEIKRKASSKDLISSPHVYAFRHFPVNTEGQTEVRELVEVEKENTRIGDEEMWYGEGELRLGNSPNEELEEIDPILPLYAVYYQIGFTNTGAKVLEKIEPS
ncbi:MAG: acetoacetate decarboxylase family protein [Nitrososphaerales archaeon]